MNRDDRNALIELGRQFVPSLFDGLDPAETNDDQLIAVIGEAFGELQTGGAVEPHDPTQPSRAEIADWLGGQELTVSERKEKIIEKDGECTRTYIPNERPATIYDVLSWRYDGNTGLLSVVLCDGSKSEHAFRC